MTAIKKTKPTIKAKKAKTLKNFASGRLYVKSTFNNTIVSITDPKGNVLSWASSGHVGFSGAKKSTPFAATVALEKVSEAAKNFGIKKLSVYVNGPGSGRDSVLRFLRGKKDFDVDFIADITAIPHNGPRPPKRRKV